MKVTQDYINHLADKYINTVLRISYTYLGNRADAEDTVQDVFLQIIDKKPEFNDETHEKAWIVRTTVNMCKTNSIFSGTKTKSPLMMRRILPFMTNMTPALKY